MRLNKRHGVFAAWGQFLFPLPHKVQLNGATPKLLPRIRKDRMTLTSLGWALFGRESANIMPAFGWGVCDDSEIFQVSKQHWGRHSEEEMVQRGRDKKRVVFPYG
jgi:hypothetical protein